MFGFFNKKKNILNTIKNILNTIKNQLIKTVIFLEKLIISSNESSYAFISSLKSIFESLFFYFY